ncbi:MAG: molecular chaperone SurA [Gammaproteobacteria bacterium]|nr:molecular chaperone SurA [Gammaproteobacteria bacterium]
MRSRSILLALLLGLGPAAHAAVVPLDRIVAVVNNDVIVLSELENRVRTIRAQLRQSGTSPPPESVLERQVLERLILDRLQLQMAENMGIRVDDTTLNRAVAQLAQRNGLSVRQFRDILERDGYDFARFREDVRNEIIISRLQQRQINNRVTVSQREVENYLATRAQQANPDTEYRLGHILIGVPEAASPDAIAAARAKAEEVLASVRAGVDFAQTAVAVSDGQQALQGGDLGWRKQQQLPTIFAEVVRGMQPGEVAGPIRSPSGFHIVKLVEKRGQEKHVITQTHARHILIRTDELTSEAEARRQLEQLQTRIENDEPFTELARAHSDDRGSAVNGGDLGWLSPGDTVSNFENVMNGLAAGEVSEPFRSQFGWHIVQVVERRRYDGTEEVRRTQALEQIRQRKSEQELDTWLRELRDEAYVEYRLEE